MDKRIENITLKEGNTIKEAMECINKSGVRMVVIIDEDLKVLGVVTDGDIRNSLVKGKNLDSSLKEIMITNPITAQENTPASMLLDIMLSKYIQEIPVVDAEGRIIDIALLRDLKSIPLSSPDITHKEVEIINQVLATPFLSIGPKVKEFEEKAASYIGTKYAIAVNSGTSGLHLCVRSLGIKDGDEVITAPFSFISSANCILFERAKPVFVDIDKDTLCIDVSKIEEKITPKTRAILPVHIFGNPAEMEEIMRIAKKHNLYVIEDACEAIGTEYQGKKVGSFGDAGVFGFYPNKQMTTCEGGMIVTNDEKIAKLCQSMRNQGRDENDSWLSYSRLGYNYRLGEIEAALGLIQLERMNEMLEKRQRVADHYNKRLADVEGIKIPYLDPRIKISWFVYIIRLNPERFSKEDRDKIIERLENRGISCRNYFPPIHLQPFYVEMFGFKKGDFPITEQISDSTIALPFYNNLTEKEIDYICDNLKDILKTYNKR